MTRLKLVSVVMRLRREQRDALKRLARETRIPQSVLLREAIADNLQKRAGLLAQGQQEAPQPPPPPPPLRVVPLAECYERGIIPRPRPGACECAGRTGSRCAHCLAARLTVEGVAS